MTQKPLNEARAITLGLFVIALLLAPYFCIGEKFYVGPVWDNLDSNWVWYKVLAQSGQIFAPSEQPIPAIMNGVPRGSLGSEFYFPLWLVVTLGVYNAIVINLFLTKSIAFVGLFFLLKKHLAKQLSPLMALLIALSFAFLPFWQPAGLTVAGLPILVLAILNIRKNNYVTRDWVIICFYPFYSSFVVGGIFALSFFWGGLLFETARTKGLNKTLLVAISALTLCCLVVEYRLFHSLIYETVVSHRLEFKVERNFQDCLSLFIESLTIGATHSRSPFARPIFVVLSVAIWCAIISKDRKSTIQIIAFASLLFLTAILHGFWRWEILEGVRARSNLLNQFQIDRYYMFSPFLWALALAVSIQAILKRHTGVKAKRLIIAFLLCTIAVNIRASNWAKGFENSFSDQPRTRTISLNEYFSSDLFSEIQNSIPERPDKYRVAALGFDPAVLLFNGFRTVDGYVVNYALAYKHKFRRVIAQELSRNQLIADDFDNWGSRCYLYDDSVGLERRIHINRGSSTRSLDIDTELFKKLGGRYVISSVEIEELSPGLEHVGFFDNGIWAIHLYRVN